MSVEIAKGSSTVIFGGPSETLEIQEDSGVAEDMIEAGLAETQNMGSEFFVANPSSDADWKLYSTPHATIFSGLTLFAQTADVVGFVSEHIQQVVGGIVCLAAAGSLVALGIKVYRNWKEEKEETTTSVPSHPLLAQTLKKNDDITGIKISRAAAYVNEAVRFNNRGAIDSLKALIRQKPSTEDEITDRLLQTFGDLNKPGEFETYVNRGTTVEVVSLLSLENRQRFFNMLVRSFLSRHETLAVIELDETSQKNFLEEYWNLSQKFLMEMKKAFPSDKMDVVETLDDPSADTEKRIKALKLYLAYQVRPRLFQGAERLMQLMGEEVILGLNSSIEIFDPENAAQRERKTPLKFTEWLDEIYVEFARTEKKLAGYPTVGGKIRMLEFKDLRGEFLTSGKLIVGERRPYLLWPARDPRILARTISVLMRRQSDPRPDVFRLSIGISGEVGDDLIPAALGLQAILPIMDELPEVIKSEVGINWFSPVVEGGVGGPMGHIEKDPKPQFDKIDEYHFEGPAEPTRYDHLFVSILNVPQFPLDEVWSEKYSAFLNEQRPEIVSIDMEGHSIEMEFTETEGQTLNAVWTPSKGDWNVIVKTMKNVENGGAERYLSHDEEEFCRHFFVEYVRTGIEHQIVEVYDTAWALGLLREAAQMNGPVVTFGEGFSKKKVARLKEGDALYRKRFASLLDEKGLGNVLKQQWVDNHDWHRIRSDVVSYQEALKEDPAWHAKIRELVEESVAEVRDILEVE